MIVDGKKIANEILDALLRQGREGLKLGVVMNEGDAASDSFVKIKERNAARVGVQIVRFAAQDFDKALACDGVIVQLPIPDADSLIKRIPPEKDADALGSAPKVLAPVAAAVGEVLSRYNVALANKKAVVVGAGRLVGKPVANLLRDTGAHVSVVTETQGSLEELKDADIVVLGAGNPGLVKPDMLKPGVVLLDAGTSESEGRVAGDADPRCAEVASIFTPVPGGLGPVAVAMIFKNLFALNA